MAMTHAARYRARHVLIGIMIATAVVPLVPIDMGRLTGNRLARQPRHRFHRRGDPLPHLRRLQLPRGPAHQRGGHKGPAQPGAALLAGGGAFFSTGSAHDQLVTITLATKDGWLGTWIRCTVGMVLAGALGIGVGACSVSTCRARHQGGNGAAFLGLGLLLISDGRAGPSDGEARCPRRSRRGAIVSVTLET